MYSPEICPLCCQKVQNKLFHQEKFRRYFYQCSSCDLIFVSRKSVLSSEDERARYELHQNNEISDGYQKFLERLLKPIAIRLPNTALGLDFGEGPYPMLREVFAKSGYCNVSGFDPFFSPDTHALLKKYDFITMCEVIEHMHDPISDLTKIVDMLNSGGLLVISTGLVDDSINLQKWYYINDITHVNFFSRSSFNWMESKLDLEILQVEKDLIIFLKK